jgi:D-sedoheptulose 7-phosphate isomerase
MEKEFTKIIYTGLEDAHRALDQLKEPTKELFLKQVAFLLADCFTKGNKVIIAGNGGSLCDASHFAEELTGFFYKKRKALPAIVLSEPGHITCTANDIGYEWVFSRGVEAHGKAGDIFIGLSTSGNSISIIHAFEKAKELGLHTVSFLGKDGGKLRGKADFELLIAGFSKSDRAQEVHMTAMHMIIEMVEAKLFGS